MPVPAGTAPPPSAKERLELELAVKFRTSDGVAEKIVKPLVSKPGG